MNADVAAAMLAAAVTVVALIVADTVRAIRRHRAGGPR